MKIAFFETEPHEKKYFQDSALKEHELAFFEGELEMSGMDELKETEVLSLFVFSKLTAEMIEAMPSLKLVATRSTGFDHIDINKCREKGIKVSTVPHYGENTVAEHTFGLILDLARKIHRAYVRTIRGNFSQEGLEGFDLKGKTLGLIGCGHIGIRVVMIARGFGMNVLVCDPSHVALYSELLGFDYVDLDELLARSDIISLHAPHNKSTHHLINQKTLAKMKPDAILINTARGGLVDTEALLEALNENRLGGAGLDVLEGEEFIKEEWQLVAKTKDMGEDMVRTLLRNHLLLNREDVIITPHNAFNSREARMRILDTTIKNIVNYASGKPINTVD
jgi:D-lactate dehydrogenase